MGQSSLLFGIKGEIGASWRLVHQRESKMLPSWI